MFHINGKKALPAVMLAIAILTTLMTGCGSRQSNTGSFRSRLIDEKGDIVINAKCYSLFQENEIVYSGIDGSFRISELPAGRNNIIIQHQEFSTEQFETDIKPDQETVVDFIRLDRLGASNRISDVKVSEITSTSVEISWKTYKELCCNIHYGISTGYGTFVSEERPSKEHHYTLTNLEPEKVYHFKVQYIDESANSYSSYDYSFRTLRGATPSVPVSVSIANMTKLGVVSVNWLPPTTALSVASYNLYRQKNGENWVKVNGIPITKTLSYDDIEAETGVFCRYAVTALNDQGGESEKKISDLVFVPGVVKKDISITKADSPVKLTADLIIPMGVNMVVEAGSEFLISESDYFNAGNDENRVEILVHGALTVNGTKEEPVIFTPLDGSGKRDHWSGIRVLSSETGISSIRYANFFGCANYALDVNSVNAVVKGISVKHSVGGMSFTGVKQSIDIDDCFIDDISKVALNIKNCFHLQFMNSVINNAEIGIENFTDKVIDQTFIRSVDIYAKNTGIKGTFANSVIAKTLIVSPIGIDVTEYLRDDGNVIDHSTVDARMALIMANGNPTVKNNIFTNTDMKGETAISYGNILYRPIYNYNDIYGFSKETLGCQVGTDSLSLEPRFLGGNPYSYELDISSLLLINDEYGTELGRYGNSRS